MHCRIGLLACPRAGGALRALDRPGGLSYSTKHQAGRAREFPRQSDGQRDHDQPWPSGRHVSLSEMSLLPHLERVLARENLPVEQARAAMQVILSGQASPPQIAAFLVALRMEGETAEELAGFAGAMREMAVKVDPDLRGAVLLDTCGTGGDCSGTFNISTVARFRSGRRRGACCQAWKPVDLERLRERGSARSARH